MNLPRVRISIPVGHDSGIDHHIATFLWILAKERDGITCELELEITPDKPVCQTRNRQVRSFLKGDAEYVLFMDRDCIPDIPGFDLLLEAIQREDVGCVGGWSVMKWHDDKCVPMILVPKGTRPDGSVGAMVATEILGRTPGLYEIPGLGLATHVLMAKREVLEAFRRDGHLWFEDILEKDPKSEKFGARINGHDILFCTRLQDLGFKLWLDTRVLWGHFKSVDLRRWFLDNLLVQQELHSHAHLARILRRIWGNFHFTAPEDFLLRLCLEAGKVPQGSTVFECGSGLSTAVLHEILPPGSYLALEDEEDWAESLLAYDKGVSVKHAPIRDYGEYEWYTFPQEIKQQYSNGSRISLVVCDGPKTDRCKGGRFGVLDQLEPYLADQFVMMVDDAHLTQGHDALQEWKKDSRFKLRYEEINCTPDGVNPPRAFTVVRGEKVTHGG